MVVSDSWCDSGVGSRRIHLQLPLLVCIALLAIAGGTAVGTGFVRRYAVAHGVLDVPNERSLHETPTPRGGGLFIAIAWLVGIPALTLMGLLSLRVGIALVGGGVAIAAVGWWDDRHDVRPSVRLAMQFAAAGWTLAWLGGVPEVRFGSWTWNAGAAGVMLAVAGLMWLTNLYNFMDGIDGIAGAQALTAGLGGGVILFMAGAPGLALASLGLAAATAGFLVWNWPPARIFMGDVGSSFLGYAFGSIALAAERTGAVPLSILLITLGVFIYDATYTLLRRAIGGQRIFVAHRSHVYQRLVASGWSHRDVTLIVLTTSAALAGAAWLAWRRPEAFPWVITGVVGGLGVMGWVLLRKGSGPIRW